MIPKKCWITDKGKIYIILHGQCKYVNIAPHNMCKNCSYYTFKKRALKSNWAAEIKADMLLYLPEAETEQEIKQIISSEIETEQIKGFIKK